MRKQPLGCITTSGILTAVIVALAIFGFWTAQGGAMFNPAPLSTNRGPDQPGWGVHPRRNPSDTIRRKNSEGGYPQQ